MALDPLYLFLLTSERYGARPEVREKEVGGGVGALHLGVAVASRIGEFLSKYAKNSLKLLKDLKFTIFVPLCVE